jgi:hypothetical protein
MQTLEERERCLVFHRPVSFFGILMLFVRVNLCDYPLVCRATCFAVFWLKEEVLPSCGRERLVVIQRLFVDIYTCESADCWLVLWSRRPTEVGIHSQRYWYLEFWCVVINSVSYG